jgi:hypothetical protein
LLDGVIDPFSLYNYCSPVPGEHFFAGVAQLVEQLIRNQQVSGSSPLAGLENQAYSPAWRRAFLQRAAKVQLLNGHRTESK